MMSRRRWLGVAVLAVLLLVVAVMAVRQLTAPPRWNVILLSMESTRAEAIGPDTTPVLWRLSQQGIRFTHHRAVSAWTAANAVSFLTGLSPFTHGIQTRGQSVPPGWALPLKDLAAAGWRVEGLQPFMALDAFQHLGLTVDPGADLEGWLAARAQRRQPFFLWYHYLDTHLPYHPAPEFMPDWGALLPPGDKAAEARIRAVMTDPAIPAGSIHFQPGDLPAIRALYLGNIRQFDAWFGRFWHFFEASGLRRDTILVLTADHADELLERGNVGHASTSRAGDLHEELVRIPLVIWLPPGLGAPEDRPRVVDAPTDHLDIMPTLMHLLGVRPKRALPGADLLGPLPAGRPWTAATSRAGFDEPDPDHLRHFIFARAEGRWKLQLYQDDGAISRRQLFDLAADPTERMNVRDLHPDIARRLEDALKPWIETRRQPGKLGQGSVALAGSAAPRWRFPAASGHYRYDDLHGRFRLEWSGPATATYLIQYVAGEGLLALKGEIEVQGTVKDFGTIDRLYWDKWIVPYGHFRLRVGLAGGDLWSRWLDLQAEP